MVIYDLTCSQGHRFEGWFPNAQAFEEQREKLLVHCSVCGNQEVERLPTGGHISTHVKEKKAPSSSSKDMAANVDPVIFMKALHHYVTTHFKDVGSDFTDKAIKMHHGEIPRENIYGESKPEDLDRLEEEGVQYSVVPKLPNEFEN